MAESGLSNLRERAENGDEEAADELIELAPERGDMDELRHFADRGNATATDQLIELATERGDMDELRHFADRGNATATDQLMEFTAEQTATDGGRPNRAPSHHRRRNMRFLRSTIVLSDVVAGSLRSLG